MLLDKESSKVMELAFTGINGTNESIVFPIVGEAVVEVLPVASVAASLSESVTSAVGGIVKGTY